MNFLSLVATLTDSELQKMPVYIAISSKKNLAHFFTFNIMDTDLIFVIFFHKCTFGLNFSPHEISRQNSVNNRFSNKTA